MALITINCLIYITAAFVCLITTIYLYFNYHLYTYWSKKRLPHIPAKGIFGSVPNPKDQQVHVGVTFKNFYDQMKAQGHKHFGIYLLGKATYFPIDLDYIKTILTKDFQFFTDRRIYYNERDDPLSAHLFALGGERWKNLRVKLSPTFTTGKMKQMFQIMVECGRQLEEETGKLVGAPNPVDIRNFLACFTIDIIGSSAFGLDCNSFKDPESRFRYYATRVFSRTLGDRLRFIMGISFPALARALHVRITRKEISDFFMGVLRDAVDYRKKNKVVRNDFLQLLIEMYKDGEKSDENSITFNELAAQSFVFFIGGFETSSTLMTFTLFELANNQDIQDKLRDEINSTIKRHDGKITYEGIQEMKYMDKVLNETLRKYPPVAFITRESVQDYKMPDSNLVLEKSTGVFISVLGLHHDEEYYPNPEVFDPERFSEKNVKERHHYAFLPFGEGPRNCIGMRFGLLQSKIGLTMFLRGHRVTLNKKTQTPLEMSVSNIILTAKGDIWLDVEKI